MESDYYDEYEISDELCDYFDFAEFGAHMADEKSGQFVNGGFIFCDVEDGLDLIMDNLNSKSVKADVDTYLYGEGKVFVANEYEVAAFTGRGEKFLTHPDVHWQGSSEFTVYPPVIQAQKLVDNLGFI